MKQKLLNFIRNGIWFGKRWHYITFCTRHSDYKHNCAVCEAGFWYNVKRKYKGGFSPGQSFLSPLHAVSYCKAQPDPDKALLSVLAHNVANGERSFAIETLNLFYENEE